MSCFINVQQGEHDQPCFPYESCLVGDYTANDDLGMMASLDAVEEFEPGHADRVTVVDVNSDGSRLATGSIDHRIKIWDLDEVSGGRNLVETFTAHAADIRDVRGACDKLFTNLIHDR